MLRRAGLLAATTGAALVVLAGVGLVLWGAVLNSVITDGDARPFAGLDLAWCVAGMAVMGGGFALIDRIARRAQERWGIDAKDDLAVLVMVLWWAAVAVGVVALAVAVL